MPRKYKVFFSGVSEDLKIHKTQIFLTSERIYCQITKVKKITEAIMLNSPREVLFE